MHSHLNVDHARPRMASPTSPPAISISRAFPRISIAPPIVDRLKQGAAVAIGVSGGKDSQAAAMATFEYLDRIGHSGPRLLIHADLGSVEWADSLPTCEHLADRLGAEFVVVRRKQGGLMDRWESRWRSNVARSVAAAAQPETHDLYRHMVGLECRSTFAFQSRRWLGDIAPHLLEPRTRDRLAMAKDKAHRRREAECRLTKPMLYVKGWPIRMLSDGEADLFAEVRLEVSTMVGIRARYLDRSSIHARYAELLDMRDSRGRAA